MPHTSAHLLFDRNVTMLVFLTGTCYIEYYNSFEKMRKKENLFYDIADAVRA